MAHCISLDETLPTKSMDIATQNVTHIHYGNSQSQSNPNQVGCYSIQHDNLQTCTHSVGGSNNYYQVGAGRCGWAGTGGAYQYFDSSDAALNFAISGGQNYVSDHGGHNVGNSKASNYITHTYYYGSRYSYSCPYTYGETLMSIGVLHMDKVGARRTLTINFDDQITNAGSVISYAWNTGATTQSITVNQRGTYYCDVTWQETQSQVNHTVRLTYTF